MDTDIVVRVAVAVIVLVLGLALLVYNVQRKWRRMKSELKRADVLHLVSKDGVEDTDFGTHEFAALDLDGNLIGFFTWVQ